MHSSPTDAARPWRRWAMVPLLVALLLPLAGPAAAHEDDQYEFTGSGWGHSVGMSQYGAFGRALEGTSSNEILTYYYAGTTIRTIDDLVADGLIDGGHPIVAGAEPLWVGVRQDETSFDIAPVGGPFEICRIDEAGPIQCVDGGWTDGAATPWRIERLNTAPPEDDPVYQCRVGPVDQGLTVEVLDDGTCRLQISWGGVDQADRVAFDGDECEALDALERECFAHGTVHVRSAGVADGFHVAISLPLEKYLYGLGEVPSSWPTAALNTQAIAGRTYAGFRLLGNEDPSAATAIDPGLSDSRKTTCWCHMFSTVADQNYVGFAKEGAVISGVDWGAVWVAAVDSTAGKVVTHPTEPATESTIIQAFYHSSSGGNTETNVTVWNGGPVAYLQVVDDHWSNSAAVSNPFASWTFTTDAGTLANLLGWDRVDDGGLRTGAPAARFWFNGENNGEEVETEIKAATLYSWLGTRSPHIDGVSIDRFLPFSDIEDTVHQPGIVAIWEAGITTGCDDGLYCPLEFVTRAQMATFMTRAIGLDPVAENQFSDTVSGNVHTPAINAVAEAGISVGCKPGLFCPEDSVTRAQMATFLTRALELEPVAGQVFDDVDPTSTHADSINAIAAAGITLGCEPSRFCPDDDVTRAQMATFLDRAFLQLSAGA